MFRNIWILPLTMLLLSCSTYSVFPYRTIGGTRADARSETVQSPKGYALGTFFRAPTVTDPIRCRLSGDVVAYKRDGYVGYIAEALRAELKDRGIYNAASSEIISGHLDFIEFTSADLSLSLQQRAHWKIDATISIGDKSMPITATYEFYLSNAHANIACQEIADAFPYAVRALFRKLFESSFVMQNDVSP